MSGCDKWHRKSRLVIYDKPAHVAIGLWSPISSFNSQKSPSGMNEDQLPSSKMMTALIPFLSPECLSTPIWMDAAALSASLERDPPKGLTKKDTSISTQQTPSAIGS